VGEIERKGGVSRNQQHTQTQTGRYTQTQTQTHKQTQRGRHSVTHTRTDTHKYTPHIQKQTDIHTQTHGQTGLHTPHTEIYRQTCKPTHRHLAHTPSVSQLSDTNCRFRKYVCTECSQVRRFPIIEACFLDGHVDSRSGIDRGREGGREREKEGE
jgi:hypothetical protein